MQAYQLSLATPKPPRGVFEPAAAGRSGQREVVDHHGRHFATRLSEQEKADLSEFLKSI